MLNRLAKRLYDRGLGYASYRAAIEKNQDAFDDVYADPAFTEADLELLRKLPPLRIVAIGEDWCPDVFHTLPTWARVAEEVAGWEMRVFPRDENPHLMEGFLYRDKARRIPVYAFYDRELRLQTWWSGRCREAQVAVDLISGGTPYGQLDEATQGRVAAFFREQYAARYRRGNFEEVLSLLRAFFHV